MAVRELDAQHKHEEEAAAESTPVEGIRCNIRQGEDSSPVRSRSRRRRYSLNKTRSKSRRRKDENANNDNESQYRSRSRGRTEKGIAHLDPPEHKGNTRRHNALDMRKSTDVPLVGRSRSIGRKADRTGPLRYRSRSRGSKINNSDCMLDQSQSRVRKSSENDPLNPRAPKSNDAQHEYARRGRGTTVEVEPRARSLSRGRRIAEGALSIVSAALAATVIHKLNQSKSGSLTSETEEHICNDGGSQKNGGWISRLGFRSFSKLTFDRGVDDTIPLAGEDSVLDIDFAHQEEATTMWTTDGVDHSLEEICSSSNKNNEKIAFPSEATMESEVCIQLATKGTRLRSRKRRDSIRSATYMKSAHEDNNLSKVTVSPTKSKVPIYKLPSTDHSTDGGTISSYESLSPHRLSRPPASPRRKVVDDTTKIVASANEENSDTSSSLRKEVALQHSFLELVYDETNCIKDFKNNISTTSLILSDLDWNDQSDATLKTKTNNQFSESFMEGTSNCLDGKKERRRSSCTNFTSADKLHKASKIKTPKQRKETSSPTRKSHITNCTEQNIDPIEGHHIVEVLANLHSTTRLNCSARDHTIVSTASSPDDSSSPDESKRKEKIVSTSATCVDAKCLEIPTHTPKSNVKKDSDTIDGVMEQICCDKKTVEFAESILISPLKDSKKKHLTKLIATKDNFKLIKFEERIGKNPTKGRDATIHANERREKGSCPANTSPSRKSSIQSNADKYKSSQHSRKAISSTSRAVEETTSDDKTSRVRPSSDGIVEIRSRSPPKSKNNHNSGLENKSKGRYSSSESLTTTELRHDFAETIESPQCANASPRRTRKSQQTASIDEISSNFSEIDGKRQPLSDRSKPLRSRKNCFDWIESEFQTTTSTSSTSPSKHRQSTSPSKSKHDSLGILTSCASIAMIEDKIKCESSNDRRPRSNSRGRSSNAT